MKYFVETNAPRLPFNRYRRITPRAYFRAKKIGAALRGRSVVHINSTALGGGVAEILKSQIPLERSLGINAGWYVLNAPPDFFAITKKIHNLLQGKMSGPLTERERQRYTDFGREAAEEIRSLCIGRNADIAVLHDPQPMPLIPYIPRETKTLLRLHIDLSTPNPRTLEFLRPLVQRSAGVILTSRTYRPLWLPPRKARIIMPAIDPFTEKNRNMPRRVSEKILTAFGIHTEKPLIAQISRFDPWKDPVGVMRAYYLAKNKIPNLVLVLVGSFAADDPEGRDIFRIVQKHARGDPDIHLITEENPLLVNAVQTASAVILQKSIREGFGLTVTEAMWKEKTVIGGKTEGISLQIKDGKNGFLVSSPEEAARVLTRVLPRPRMRRRIGAAAKKTVKEKFLMSRLVLEHLETYQDAIRQPVRPPG